MESPINPWMIWAKSSHLMDLLFRRFHPPGRYYGPSVELQKGIFFSRFRSLFWGMFGCFMFSYYCSCFWGWSILLLDQFFFPVWLCIYPFKKVSWNSRLNPRHAFETNYIIYKLSNIHRLDVISYNFCINDKCIYVHIYYDISYITFIFRYTYIDTTWFQLQTTLYVQGYLCQILRSRFYPSVPLPTSPESLKLRCWWFRNLCKPIDTLQGTTLPKFNIAPEKLPSQ